MRMLGLEVGMIFCQIEICKIDPMANEAATAKDAQFVLINLLPDVCLTPTKSGYPVPYVITHKMDQSEQVSPNVFFRDVLHNSLRSVIARPRAVHCVTFLANSPAIGCKKMPCGPSRSALSPTREGYAVHP